jgi:S1-C subfamily serine protease
LNWCYLLDISGQANNNNISHPNNKNETDTKTYVHSLIIPIVVVTTIFVTSDIIFHSIAWASDDSTLSSNILTLEGLALNKIFNDTQGSVVQISHSIQGNQSVYYGSGFIYNEQGYIVTNNHVVNGTNTVNVTFTDGNVYTANVIGTDHFNDIAVIKIADDLSSENIVPLVLGNSSNVKVGQLAIAIGNPLGFTNSMTLGIISQIGRLFPAAELPGGLGGFYEADIIQTDAAINHGNSGGPLLDMQGQVIGMNTFSPRTSAGTYSTGIGFAIPSNSIQRIVPALIQNGSYSHPWLGLIVYSMNPDIAERIGLPKNSKGVLVTHVDPGGPSRTAGLLASNSSALGDIIVGIDGHPVKRMDDIISYLEEHKSVGESTTLTIIRNGQEINLTAVLQARPQTSGA